MLGSVAKIEANSMQFPILAFSYERKHVGVVFSEDELIKPSTVALKKGYFNNLFIVDCKGTAYVVRSVRRVGSSWTSLLLSLVNEGRHRVALEIDEVGEVSIAHTKSLVCAAIEMDSDFWSAMTGDYNDIKGQVRQAKTFDAIVRSLG